MQKGKLPDAAADLAAGPVTVLTLWLTEPEYDELQKAARSDGLRLSTWIRRELITQKIEAAK